jgi:peptidyl-prolyl cis-trans isomerase B (cyclophilin B)
MENGRTGMTRAGQGLFLVLALGWLGCGAATQDGKQETAPAAAAAAAAPVEQKAEATLSKQFLMKTDKGEILLELDYAKAPKTCANFEHYAAKGHYNGTVFHRVISSFMIQGGGLDSTLSERATDPPIENEAGNGLKNTRGTIAMARTGAVHSATSQFFINVVDNDFLNFRSPDPQGFGYCVFGHVVKGMEVVDAIRNVPTGNRGMYQNVPTQSVLIESVTLVK